MWRTRPLGLRNSGHALSAEVIPTSDQSSRVPALPVLSDSLCATGVRESLNENEYVFVCLCSASTKQALYSQAHVFSTMQYGIVALMTMNLVYIYFCFAFPVD